MNVTIADYGENKIRVFKDGFQDGLGDEETFRCQAETLIFTALRMGANVVRLELYKRLRVTRFTPAALKATAIAN